MVIKYTKIFHSKTLQNLPKFGFWFENKPSGNPAFDWVMLPNVVGGHFWTQKVWQQIRLAIEIFEHGDGSGST
jgi:hypothetical protein